MKDDRFAADALSPSASAASQTQTRLKAKGVLSRTRTMSKTCGCRIWTRVSRLPRKLLLRPQ